MNFFHKQQQQHRQHRQRQHETVNQRQQLKRKKYFNTTEQYEYEDIVLPDINVFKPNIKLMDNIRKMEKHIHQQNGYSPQNLHRQQHQLHHQHQLQQSKRNDNRAVNERENGNLRDIIRIQGHPRKGLKISTCSRCDTNIPVSCIGNKQQQRGIYCQVLGPLLCTECHTQRKQREKEKATRSVIEEFDVRDYPTDKEKAIFKILLGHVFMNYENIKDQCIARNNESLMLHSKRNLRCRHSSNEQKTLRDSLKLATHLWKEIENKKEKEKKIRKEERDSGGESKKHEAHEGEEEKDEDVVDLLKNEVKQKILLPPPNSMSTPQKERMYRLHSPASSCRSLLRSSSPTIQKRTDLQWFNEISQQRLGDNTRNDNRIAKKQNGGIDVILLATKLSEIFKQRYLPPERTLSRISSISSVDLLDYCTSKSECSDRLITLQRQATGTNSTVETNKIGETNERGSSSSSMSARRISLHTTIIEERKDNNNNDSLSSIPTEPPLVSMDVARRYLTPHIIETFY